MGFGELQGDLSDQLQEFCLLAFQFDDLLFEESDPECQKVVNKTLQTEKKKRKFIKDEQEKREEARKLVIEEKKLRWPNVIKIDVEGYEYMVIKGLENTLRKESCKLVCCEVHPTLLTVGTTPNMVLDLLKSSMTGSRSK